MRLGGQSLNRIVQGATVTDLKYTRTLTPEGALKALNAAIVEATRMGQPLAHVVRIEAGRGLPKWEYF
jgi:hypothetical protein